MHISKIATVIDAHWILQSSAETIVSQLMLDTRHLPMPGALYFAIVGQRHNGHRFLKDAWAAGVRQFVVSQPVEESAFPGSNILLVKDTLQALQQLAAFHRSQFNCPVIGITGSNGKTVVKEWLFQVLHSHFEIVRSPKSYNSQVGVPLSVWAMEKRHTLGIFEAGISQPGEMNLIAAVIQPNIGVFTNIGPAHQEGFDGLEEKVAEKMRLFESAQALVFCADHPLIALAAQKWAAAKKNRLLFSWSAAGNPALVQVRADISGSSCRLQITLPEMPLLEAEIPFADAASIENSLHTFVSGIALGMDTTFLSRSLTRLYPIEMRLELKKGIENSTLINDFYNNDLTSLRILMQFGRQQQHGRGVTLILSDILQSGLAPEKLYQEVAGIIVGIDHFIGVGTEIPAIAHFLPEKTSRHFFANTGDLLKNVATISWTNQLILLKGARPFAFEDIAVRLEQKAHHTRLEINLSALIHNLNAYNALLQPGVKMMVMVKAEAYGSGGNEVARLLEFHKVDYLGVAYADEGIKLRHSGVELPILVLNPEFTDFDVFQRYQLEPEIFSLEILQKLIEFTGRNKNITVHLKLDTGMHRLGFESTDLPALCQILTQYPNLKIASVFTHLSASDNPEHNQFTHHQAALFTEMYNSIAGAIGYTPIRHVANSSGMEYFPEYHFDMVRLGVGIYGIGGKIMQPQLQVVNTLKTTVSQVKNIPAGESVGYNRNSGLLANPRKIATIGIGYADGLLRLAGGGNYKMMINNCLVPTIGNVCMDMTMLDITGAPEVQPGDEVIVFGENPPVQQLAHCLQTIPYEIFTNISERVKRVYLQE